MEFQRENIINQARTIWQDMTNDHHVEGRSLYDETSLDMLSKTSQRVIAIISMKNYDHLYVSPNVKELVGYTAEEEPSLGILKYISMLTYDHLTFPITAGRWYLKWLKETAFENKVNQRIVFVGSKMKHRNGKVLRTLIQTSHLKEDQKRNPVIIINTVQDIAHLMKDDFWWMRFSCGEDSSIIRYYHSESGKTFDGDILSDREKDILLLIQQGHDSPHIAEELSLSVATVQTHRRNMLARTGMRDITGLLQVAIAVGII